MATAVFESVSVINTRLLSLNSAPHVLFLQEVMEMRNQIAQSGVHVDIDAPKGQDLSEIMNEIRAKYEKTALQNQEELKLWHESQVKHRRREPPRATVL